MEGSEDAIVVQIGVFSGRPNPEMSLTDEAAVEFADLVKSALGQEPIHPPPPPKLGKFYGFLVQVPEQKVRALDLPSRVNIFSGVLTDMTSREQTHWRDTVGLERFLLHLAYERGFGELLEKVGLEQADLVA
jgi:hypothetical protein